LTKVAFFAHFDSLIGHINTLENSGAYYKIGYLVVGFFIIFPKVNVIEFWHMYYIYIYIYIYINLDSNGL
jgi:hypothetical protein